VSIRVNLWLISGFSRSLSFTKNMVKYNLSEQLLEVNRGRYAQIIVISKNSAPVG
jgi:hypothetical protein